MRKAMGLIALLVALGVVAISASAASAAPTIRNANTGKALKAGKSTIDGFSANLTFTTVAGALECTSNELAGPLTANGGPTEVEVEQASFTGGLEPGGVACETGIPSEAPAVGTLHAVITPEDLNWPLSFGAAGETALEGTPEVRFTAELFANVGGMFVGPVAVCTYGSAFVENEANINGGTPLEDEVTAQGFAIKAAVGNCPPAGELNGTFVLTGEEVGVAGILPLELTNP